MNHTSVRMYRLNCSSVSIRDCILWRRGTVSTDEKVTGVNEPVVKVEKVLTKKKKLI